MLGDMAELDRTYDTLPDGWRSLRLGDVARLSGGTTPSRSEAGYWEGATIPWATPSDITSLPAGVSTIGGTERMVTERALVECSLPLNPPGTVLMTSRATIGFAAINIAPMTTNQGFITFNADPNLDPEFLLHWLIAQRLNLMAAAGGSTFKELSRGTAKLLPIHLPPIEEQRRIAEVLRSVDEAIAANRTTLDQIVRVRAATLHAALEETDWEPVKLRELGRWQSGGTPSKADASLWDGTIPWICPRDMKSPVVRRTESSVSEKALGGACKMAPKGSLMIVVRGMILAKAIPTATTAMNATFNQDMKAFIPNGRALPKFVQLCLQHQEQALLRLVNTATHGTKKLDADTLANVDVPLPDLATQKKLADAAADMDLVMAKYGEEHVRLARLKNAVQADLLSGRVRVAASTAGTAKSVSPAFKRAVFAAEIVHQLHNERRFGSVKHEKIVHLCELHLSLQDDLDRHAYKKAAGPYDPAARRSVEKILKQQKWFDTSKPDGKRVLYTPLEKVGGHSVYYNRYFGSQKTAIQSIIDLLRPFDTERCEIIATLYSVWNDFLIDGHEPTDDEIVASVLNDWHPSKRQIAEDRWRAALPWMREHDLVPRGLGEKTRVAKT